MVSFIFIFVLFGSIACKKEVTPGPQTEPNAVPDTGLSPETVALLSSLEAYYHPFSGNPLLWPDEELSFLDTLALTTIFGMGEATHGNAEFFEAKARIFRYLVENHDYRIFAIEADVGECMIINDAIQEGREEDLVALMTEKMLFWTWRTNEVKEMLSCMMQFNKGKDEADKIRYVGIDCQIMDNNAPLLMEYLRKNDFAGLELADTVLMRLKLQSEQEYEDYTDENYDLNLRGLEQLRDKMMEYKAELEAANSEGEFLEYHHVAEVLTQVLEVRHAAYLDSFDLELRDRFMAENVAWSSEYLGPRVFVWAHNFHISQQNSFDVHTMGYYLNEMFGNRYTNVGFEFARGYFTAYGIVNEAYRKLEAQYVEVVQDDLSLNWILSQAKAPNFHVSMGDLMGEKVWRDALGQPLSDLGMGAAWDYILWHCYQPFLPESYDHLIFIEETTATDLL